MISAAEFLQRPLDPACELYLLLGADDYLRELALEKLRRDLLEPGFADFNHQRIVCSRTTRLGPILDALGELPVLARRRLLELLQAEELTQEVASGLAPHLATGHPGVVVVLSLAPADRRKANPLVSASRRAGVVVECALGEKDRPAWIRRLLEEAGVEADPEAVREILARTGPDLRHLANQVEKLALYAGPARRITAADVDEVVFPSPEVRTGALTSAISRRQAAQAEGVLDQLLREGVNPYGLLSYLNTYLRGLAEVDSLSRRHRSTAALIRAMPHKKAYQVRNAVQELATWSAQELRRAFEMLLRADLRMKTGADPRLVLELLVLHLCSRRGRRR